MTASIITRVIRTGGHSNRWRRTLRESVGPDERRQFLDHVRVSFDAPPSPPRNVYRRGDRRRLLRQHLRYELTVGPTELQYRYADAVDSPLHCNLGVLAWPPR